MWVALLTTPVSMLWILTRNWQKKGIKHPNESFATFVEQSHSVCSKLLMLMKITLHRILQFLFILLFFICFNQRSQYNVKRFSPKTSIPFNDFAESENVVHRNGGKELPKNIHFPSFIPNEFLHLKYNEFFTIPLMSMGVFAIWNHRKCEIHFTGRKVI